MKGDIDIEAIAAGHLRALLAGVDHGADLSASAERMAFESTLERLLPAVLALEHPWWRWQSFDAFRFGLARKIDVDQAEFVGLGLLIDDQAWTPLQLRVRLAESTNTIRWLAYKVGWPGDGSGGLLRVAYGSSREGKLLESVVNTPEAATWVYVGKWGAPEGAA